jgi:hypothetical protein
MFENRVLKRMFGLKEGGRNSSWRKLHHEELHNLYASPNTIKIIESRRMRLAGHAARMGR